MNRLPLFTLFLPALMLVLSGCTRSLDTERELYAWINNPENGLVQTHRINGVQLQVKYLPPAFLALKDLKREGAEPGAFGEFLDRYADGHTFMLTIGPDEEAGSKGDIMYADITSYPDYKQRVLDLHFNIKDYLRLQTEDGFYVPVLATMESVYGLTDSRNIYLVFSPQTDSDNLLCANRLDLTFEDAIFRTGINHFVFEGDQLELPSINLNKILPAS